VQSHRTRRNERLPTHGRRGWREYRLSILLLWDLEEMLARLSDSVFDVEGWLDSGVTLPPVVPFRFSAVGDGQDASTRHDHTGIGARAAHESGL
jgi:hypothetical protein